MEWMNLKILAAITTMSPLVKWESWSWTSWSPSPCPGLTRRTTPCCTCVAYEKRYGFLSPHSCYEHGSINSHSLSFSHHLHSLVYTKSFPDNSLNKTLSTKTLCVLSLNLLAYMGSIYMGLTHICDSLWTLQHPNDIELADTRPS